MRLISLNTWCGRSLYPLMAFFRKRADQTDIFCLQEVLNSDQEATDRRHPDEHVCGRLFPKLAAELRGFDGYFAAFEDDPERMSLAVFVRRGLTVRTVGDLIVHKYLKPQETGSAVFTHRKLQYVVMECGGRDLMIVNFHGLWNAGPKTDTPDRIVQSRRLAEFLGNFAGPKVLCGDFNLLPDTESLRIVERGMRNLVREYRVPSTRTPLYRHYDDPAEPNFADYALVSPDVAVDRFEVLPDLVSDHAPLYLEFH